MLHDAPVMATIAVRDLERARRFYSEDLGLAIQADMSPDLIFFGAGGGSQLQVYARRDHVAGAATAATFNVRDLAGTVAGLEKRGVHFADYDIPGFKTGPDHIVDVGGAKLAWLTDPEDNIIALAQM
ncbi:MAG TPA: VOC family protein [Nonomuraea sp.]|nr:VOC family protein [Nonomuraea sp.]